MPGKPISDADVEALLTRREPADTELLGLAAALARIDLQRLAINVDRDVGVFSLRAATLARQAATSSVGSVSWWGRVRPKLVTSALSVFAVIGMTGVAVASDAAAPGDPLYGIDRALERVGINDGGITERLEEAATLADHGLAFEALNHAAEAVSSKSPEAASALEGAAQALQDGQGPNLDVEAMLTWMASTDLTGSEFGRAVAEQARALGADPRADEIEKGAPGQQGNSGVDPDETEGANPANKGNGGNGSPSNNGTNGDNEKPGNQGNSGNPSGNGNGQGNSGNPGGGKGEGAPGGTPPGRADK
ncbi:MAG: hypothetical protein WCE80_14215 [Acidimicrobiia bacterium]